jgi:Cof subfamily protein (haloacid dehalogenase superfamily)
VNTPLNNSSGKRLYITDLDGTLLDTSGKLRARSRELLGEAIKEGAHFGVASARGIPSILKLLDGIPLHFPIIAKNGAILGDAATGKVIATHALDTALVAPVFAVLQRYFRSPIVHTIFSGEEFMYVGPHQTPAVKWYVEGRKRAHDGRLHEVDDLEAHLKEGVVGFMMFDDLSKIRECGLALKAAFGAEVAIIAQPESYRPEFGFLTVQSKHATKGGGVGLLYQHSQLLSDMHLTVFGDEANDHELYDVAHRKIAPRNAIEEIRHRADLIIGSNGEDAVAEFIWNEAVGRMR